MPPSRTLDHTWLNRLTRQLVRDTDAADDICQDTLAVALREPEPRGRGWLAQVARNLSASFVRREAVRRRAETSAAATALAECTDDLVAEAEVQQAAVTALMELDEPYRTTLLLRFMKGRSMRSVARAMEVPIETVRTRQKRGLAQLRAKLDRQHGGRRAWVLALGVGGTALWLPGVVWMKGKLIGAGLVAAALALVFSVSFDAPNSAQTPAASSVTPITAPLERDLAVERDPVGETVESVERRSATAALVVRSVFDATGEPAANVGVSIRARRRGALDTLATTDADGVVTFEALEPGEVLVESERNVHARAELVPGETTEVVLRIDRGVDVRGVVVDAVGRAVADAAILSIQPAVRPQLRYELTRTDAAGRFAVIGVAELTMIAAHTDRHGTSDLTFLRVLEREPSGHIELSLVLPEGAATVRGRVFGPDGRPLPRAWVRLGPDSVGLVRASPPRRMTLTGADGGFEVRGLRPGTCPIKVVVPGLAPWDGQVESVAGGVSEVTARLEPGATFEGRVVDGAGRGIEGASIDFEGLSYPEPDSCSTDADGAFRLDGLPSGELAFSVDAGAHGKLSERVELSAGGVVSRTLAVLPGLTIDAVLRDASGRPLAGWRILIGGESRFYTSDGSGRFLLPNREDREYELRLHAGHPFTPDVKTVTVRPSPSQQDLVIDAALMPSATFIGRAVDESGRPLPSLRHDLRQLSADHSIAGGVVLDEAGRFRSVELPPGAYRLTLRVPDGRSAVRELALVQDEVLRLGDVVVRRH